MSASERKSLTTLETGLLVELLKALLSVVFRGGKMPSEIYEQLIRLVVPSAFMVAVFRKSGERLEMLVRVRPNYDKVYGGKLEIMGSKLWASDQSLDAPFVRVLAKEMGLDMSSANAMFNRMVFADRRLFDHTATGGYRENATTMALLLGMSESAGIKGEWHDVGAIDSADSLPEALSSKMIKHLVPSAEAALQVVRRSAEEVW